VAYPDVEFAAVESARVWDHADANVEPRHHPDDPADDWRDIIDSRDHDSPLVSSDEQYTQHPPQPREIAFEGILRVNGYVAGVLRSSTGHLIVDPGGTVDADILVPVVTIHGCVRGDIRAAQRVELAGSAKVIGDIETPRLSIDPGAMFEGRCVFLPRSEAASLLAPQDRPDRPSPAD
jgi:cytoskeletal protein CcmA (bactofilin family)